MSADVLLSFRISASYRNDPAVLRDASLEIHPGELVGLVGESGSGKSTIALAILGLLSLKRARLAGEIIFEGEDLLKKSEHQLREIRGRRISIVLQSPISSLSPALRIGTQLREVWRAHAERGKEQREASIRAALRSARLPDDEEFLRRRPSQLSVGQGQRVNIAMAILHRPALLIADEATSALDSITQSEILNLFAHLSRELKMAVLYISHDLLSVAALCNRVAILREGQIVEKGSTLSIFNSPRDPYTRKLVEAIPAFPPMGPKQDSDGRAVRELTFPEAVKAQ